MTFISGLGHHRSVLHIPALPRAAVPDVGVIKYLENPGQITVDISTGL